jgi:hypothetical protein
VKRSRISPNNNEKKQQWAGGWGLPSSGCIILGNVWVNKKESKYLKEKKRKECDNHFLHEQQRLDHKKAMEQRKLEENLALQQKKIHGHVALEKKKHEEKMALQKKKSMQKHNRNRRS